MTIAEEIDSALWGDVSKGLEEVRKENEDGIATRLMHWLVEDARKKPIPDLDKRLEEMRKRFKQLAENLRLHVEAGELVVKVSGEAEQTLRMLRLGTEWFDPDPHWKARILVGTFDNE